MIVYEIEGVFFIVSAPQCVKTGVEQGPAAGYLAESQVSFYMFTVCHRKGLLYCLI